MEKTYNTTLGKNRTIEYVMLLQTQGKALKIDTTKDRERTGNKNLTNLKFNPMVIDNRRWNDNWMDEF